MAVLLGSDGYNSNAWSELGRTDTVANSLCACAPCRAVVWVVAVMRLLLARQAFAMQGRRRLCEVAKCNATLRAFNPTPPAKRHAVLTFACPPGRPPA